MDHTTQSEGARITNIPVRLLRHDQPAQFVNHVSVGGAGDLVDLRFSQVLRPGVESEEELQQLVERGFEGHVISRLLIPEDVFRQFILGIAEQISATEDDQP